MDNPVFWGLSIVLLFLAQEQGAHCGEPLPSHLCLSCLCPGSQEELCQGGEHLLRVKHLLLLYTSVMDIAAITGHFLVYCCLLSLDCYLSPWSLPLCLCCQRGWKGKEVAISSSTLCSRSIIQWRGKRKRNKSSFRLQGKVPWIKFHLLRELIYVMSWGDLMPVSPIICSAPLRLLLRVKREKRSPTFVFGICTCCPTFSLLTVFSQDRQQERALFCF